MFRKLTYIAVAIGFFLVSCSSDKTEKDAPFVAVSEIYDEDRFADIIMDLALVEAAFRLNMANEESVRKKDEIYKDVLRAHSTDSLVFEENWAYYGYRPEKMQEVYNLVVEKIDQKRQERGAAVTKTNDE